MSASVHELIMQSLVSRLAAAPAIALSVRRDHRTALPRESCPALRVWEVEDRPALEIRKTHCAIAREIVVYVALIVRSDTARADADALWVAMQARLAPDWGAGVRLVLGPARWSDEIADLDACEVRQELRFMYATPPYQLDINPEAP